MTDRTDRELLEDAAKAHGFVRDGEDEDTSLGLHLGIDGVFYIAHVMGWSPWDPLTNSGDAFDLAVECNLHAMRSSGIRVACYAEKAQFDEDGPDNSTWREVAFCYFGPDEQSSCTRDGFPWAYDQAAATRRAIVLGAASAIGGAG